jgi:D-alanyl-D-alanine carboxypeptidase (penicillin-binding protein 5/6)
VVLTDGPAPSYPMTVQRSMAPIADPVTKPTPARKPAAKRPRGQYVVQAGAFKSRDQARKQLKLVQKRFASSFADAEAEIGSAVGGYFRVRFEGMTADAARADCKTLKAKKQACMVIAP